MCCLDDANEDQIVANHSTYVALDNGSQSVQLHLISCKSRNAKDSAPSPPAELHARTPKSQGIIARRFIARGYRIHSQTVLSFCRRFFDAFAQTMSKQSRTKSEQSSQQEQGSSQ